MPTDYDSSFYDLITGPSLQSAEIVVPLLLPLEPKSVVDVRCGMGAWLHVFRENGVEDILGLDGQHVSTKRLLIPEDRFVPIDLERPFNLDRTFDLAISLEVAEHLWPSHAQGYIDSICRLAPLILFSAAVTGQTGTHHRNPQWPEYWRKLFLSQGFLMFDPLRPRIWYDERVEWWYRQNLFLFARRDYAEENPECGLMPYLVTSRSLMLLHPWVVQANLGAKGSLARLPKLFWAATLKRLKDAFPVKGDPE